MDKVKTFHAVERAKERLKFSVDFKAVLATIKAGRAEQVREGLRRMDGRLVWDVPYGERLIRVVVDEATTFVITVLPSENCRERLRRLDNTKAKVKREFFKRLETDEL